MTGYEVFGYQFVKSFPVLSKGFDIETEYLFKWNKGTEDNLTLI